MDAAKATQVAELREELRKARFSAHQKQLKDVRTVRKLRKQIARALTPAAASRKTA